MRAIKVFAGIELGGHFMLTSVPEPATKATGSGKQKNGGYGMDFGKFDLVKNQPTAV